MGREPLQVALQWISEPRQAERSEAIVNRRLDSGCEGDMFEPHRSCADQSRCIGDLDEGCD
jgi:hypothetical protein